uniref:Uncharacterized protein n=1 Tax=Micrurus surinamensis TaxID=129470 RepID=A0A2D4PAX5_MICSU
MDFSWETLKAIIEDFKEQNPDQFYGSAYEMVEKEILKKEEEWKKEEEEESKETILTIQTVVEQNEEEAILSSQKMLNVLNVIKTRVKNHSGDRLHPEPQPGQINPICPMYQFQCSPPVQPHIYHGFEDWQKVRYPPPAMANEHPPVQNYHCVPPLDYNWYPACVIAHNQNTQGGDNVKQFTKESDPTGLGLHKAQRPV